MCGRRRRAIISRPRCEHRLYTYWRLWPALLVCGGNRCKQGILKRLLQQSKTLKTPSETSRGRTSQEIPSLPSLLDACPPPFDRVKSKKSGSKLPSQDQTTSILLPVYLGQPPRYAPYAVASYPGESTRLLIPLTS